MTSRVCLVTCGVPDKRSDPGRQFHDEPAIRCAVARRQRHYFDTVSE